NVDLEVHDVADALDAERRRAQRLGYQRSGERCNVVEHSDHRERGAVDGDRPLLDDVSRQLRVECDLHELPVVTGDPVGDPPDAVDVALHDVAAEAGTSGHGTFEVHPVAGPEAGQSRTVECLAHDIGGERFCVVVDDGQAAAVHRDRVAVADVAGDERSSYGESNRVALIGDPLDGTELLHDSGEHQPASSAASSRRGRAVIRTSAPTAVTSTGSSRQASAM